jgi:DNA-directed RNA polymerase specialized sigma24 family protein
LDAQSFPHLFNTPKEVFMPKKSTAQPHERKETTNAMWKEIDDLARAYYADKTNLDKRQGLYDALMKERYDLQADPETGAQVPKPVGSALKQLARRIVKLRSKGNLGSSVTVLTEELVQDALMREDTQTGKPWWRATVLFGRAEDNIDGRYDPEKAAIQTWFSAIMRNLFTSACRSIQAERKHLVNADDWQREDEDGEAWNPTLELLAEWALPDEPDPLRSKKELIEKVLQDQDERVRQVGMALALAPWTGDTDKEIQAHLSLSRDEFRYAKEKAMRLLKPLFEDWLDDMQS